MNDTTPQPNEAPVEICKEAKAAGFDCDVLIRKDEYQGTRSYEISLIVHRHMLAYAKRKDAQLTAAQADIAKLKSALLRVTGSLGLVIKGGNPDAEGHRDNYNHAISIIDTFAAEADRICAATDPNHERKP